MEAFEGGGIQTWLLKSPLVSVVTAVKNRPATIEKCICSVLEQNYPNVEHIIVDGASDDNTLEIIKRYDASVDYYMSEPDFSMYEGMNKGLSLAAGEYILILNSDDWYYPDAISSLMYGLKQNECDIVCGLADEVDQIGRVKRKIPKIPYGYNIKLRMPLRHETMLIPSYIYDIIGGYDASYRIIADLKLTQNAFDHQFKLMQLDQYIMAFRVDGAAFNISEIFTKERSRLLKENFYFLSDHQINLLASEYKDNFQDYRKIMDEFSEQDCLVNAIRTFLILNGVGHLF